MVSTSSSSDGNGITGVYDPDTFLDGPRFDLAEPGFVADPFPAWAAGRGCPVHHSTTRDGLTYVTDYAAAVEAASMAPTLTSTQSTSVFPLAVPFDQNGPRSIINSDPPFHTPVRRVMLPSFSPALVAEYEPITRALCEKYLDELAGRDRIDAAVEYAQRIPARVIGLILGVDESMTDVFVGWVRAILENVAHDPEGRERAAQEMAVYFMQELDTRRAEPRDDFMTQLLGATLEDGTPMPLNYILGNITLLLIAGIDTTWSAIGSSLWHLAQHPEQQQRLHAEPEIWVQAVEELLRAYAPVTMGRVATEDTEIAGCPVPSGRRVAIAFPAANRDPKVFPDPDVVDFDRLENRHLAFGSGIHRCLGSNIARMELRVALQVWLERFSSFELDPSAPVTWAGGQVRGPRSVPVLVRR